MRSICLVGWCCDPERRDKGEEEGGQGPAGEEGGRGGEEEEVGEEPQS